MTPAVWTVAVLVVATAAHAGQSESPSDAPAETRVASAPPFAFDGPAAPVPPEVIARDEAGRTTIRAVRLTEALRLDGRLDDVVYATVPPLTDFIQQEPVEGVTATEKTDAWVFFDRDRFYVAFRCWESHPEALVANEMRRDNTGIFQNDHVAFILDTFYDRRNGNEFAINPLGGRWDGQITNERQFNADWNPIWDVEVGRFEGGWTVEVAIPFKSLRYRPGRAQIWGFNARRVNRGKNETSFLTRIPNALGQMGLFRTSLAATLTGLEAPPGSRNLEVKPYLVSSVTRDSGAAPHVSNELAADVGLDLKYGVTQNLTADFTYNTDFAQVEADEQQINLTRFSLFFPEKREFFLENQGLFGFGGAGVGTSAGAAEGDVPILFYSRRVGFSRGRVAPIEAGGRLTGRVGRLSVGALSIRTGGDAGGGMADAQFSVARIKRDILRRSSVGLIATRRSAVERGIGPNDVYGVDGTFAFFDNLTINTYWARTRTRGFVSGDASYRAQLDYAGDRYGVQLERLVVGEHFNPDIGYVRRNDIRRTSGQLRFSPRPRSSRVIRKLSWAASLVYVEDGTGRLSTRDWRGEFGIEFQNSDRFTASYSGAYEFFPRPAPILGITLPMGGYNYDSVRVGFTFGQQRRMSGSMSVEHGTLYNGRKTTFSVSQGRLNVTPRLSIQPTYLANLVELAQGTATTHLAGSRVTYTMTPTMFGSALVQYNTSSHTLTANVRLRWEYRPGSELFVVYNEEQDTLAGRVPGLSNRAFIVKVNRLLRF